MHNAYSIIPTPPPLFGAHFPSAPVLWTIGIQAPHPYGQPAYETPFLALFCERLPAAPATNSTTYAAPVSRRFLFCMPIVHRKFPMARPSVPLPSTFQFNGTPLASPAIDRHAPRTGMTWKKAAPSKCVAVGLTDPGLCNQPQQVSRGAVAARRGAEAVGPQCPQASTTST